MTEEKALKTLPLFIIRNLLLYCTNWKTKGEIPQKQKKSLKLTLKFSTRSKKWRVCNLPSLTRLGSS